jgi:hypothetical protein
VRTDYDTVPSPELPGFLYISGKLSSFPDMRVLAVVPSIYDTSPGQRFRLEQWEPLLKDGGVSITYRAFETDELRKVLYQNGRMLNKLSAVTQGLVRRQNELRDVRDFDVVYVHSSKKEWLELVFQLFSTSMMRSSILTVVRLMAI